MPRSNRLIPTEAQLRVNEMVRELRKADTESSRVYVTTYCNHGHYVKSGKPVGHECYTLPPKALEAEIAGDYSTAIELLEQASRQGKLSPR